MAKRTTSEDLQQAYDDISDVKGTLLSSYRPEATREEMAEAIKDALDTLDDYEGPEEEEEEEDDQD